jgi:hypothetical protein
LTHQAKGMNASELTSPTALSASEDEKLWFSALHSFESSLCVVIEPGPDYMSPMAWIACQPSPHRPPILLFKLPLINRPMTGNPF